MGGGGEGDDTSVRYGAVVMTGTGMMLWLSYSVLGFGRYVQIGI